MLISLRPCVFSATQVLRQAYRSGAAGLEPRLAELSYRSVGEFLWTRRGGAQQVALRASRWLASFALRTKTDLRKVQQKEIHPVGSAERVRQAIYLPERKLQVEHRHVLAAFLQ